MRVILRLIAAILILIGVCSIFQWIVRFKQQNSLNSSYTFVHGDIEVIAAELEKINHKGDAKRLRDDLDFLDAVFEDTNKCP